MIPYNEMSYHRGASRLATARLASPTPQHAWSNKSHAAAAKQVVDPLDAVQVGWGGTAHVAAIPQHYSLHNCWAGRGGEDEDEDEDAKWQEGQEGQEAATGR
jgi:hypothetical protein